uniref:SFRICE_033175 n=1 Tax=Spodoptera frugiperda TaxID=7108 RepID=A0A2H1WF66_SPOFR
MSPRPRPRLTPPRPHYNMRAFITLCALLAVVSGSEIRQKRSFFHGLGGLSALGLDFTSGFSGYGSGHSSGHSSNYGSGYRRNYGYGTSQSGYGVVPSNGYGAGYSGGYYSNTAPVAVPYTTPGPAVSSYAQSYAAPAVYPASSYAAGAGYAAPATRVVAVSKVVNVQREVTVPQVVNVRRLITEPKVITVKQVVPSAGYSGYGAGAPSVYARDFSGAYSAEYSGEYGAASAASAGADSSQAGWW